MDIRQRNHVTVLGSGEPTLLFGHGFGTDQRVWRFVAPAFSNTHRRVLFDYVGAGHSDLRAYHPTRYGSLDGYVQDVLDICDALKLERSVFIGHSISAVIGMLASQREPQRFRALVMLAPSPRFLNDPPDYHGGFEREDMVAMLELMDRNRVGWAHYLAPLAIKNDDRPELIDELATSLTSGDPDIVKRFAELSFFVDARAALSRVRVPTLVVQGIDDAIAPREVGEYMHRQIPGSTLKFLNASGHCPHLSHPEQTVALIQEYLEDLRR